MPGPLTVSAAGFAQFQQGAMPSLHIAYATPAGKIMLFGELEPMLDVMHSTTLSEELLRHGPYAHAAVYGIAQ